MPRNPPGSFKIKDRFFENMDGFSLFEEKPRLAVAVSGGSDSMALCLLLQAWAAGNGGEVTAVTVDHGLRKESAAETLQVGKILEKRGIRHKILTWEGKKPVSRIQETARRERYRLLRGFCRKEGIFHLCLGHTADDQAETLVMRMRKKSGKTGLSGMGSVLFFEECRFLRPLLSFSKAELREYLAGEDASWIEDPSNDNPAYERVRIRRELSSGEVRPQAVQPAPGSDLVKIRLAAKFISLFPEGYAAVSSGILEQESGMEETVRFLFSDLLTTVAPSDYPVSPDKIDGLLSALRKKKNHTLSHCRIFWKKNGIYIVREKAFLPPPVSVTGKRQAWGDFVLAFSVLPEGAEIRALDPRDLPDSGLIFPLFHPISLTLPAVYGEGGLLFVPHIGYTGRTEGVCWAAWKPPRPFLGNLFWDTFKHE